MNENNQGTTGLLKADFHCHTCYSMDTETPLEEIIARCQEKGINCLTISDHGTAEGALEMQKLAPFKIIVGEEILTPEGEFIGLFLKETIPSGISVEEAIARVKAQGGLVSIPHPFDPLRGLKPNSERLDEIVRQVDIIEVFNARSPFPGPADKALALALKYDLPQVAGSDSHSAAELGGTFVEMPDFDGPEEFLKALRQGVITRQKSSVFVHLRSTWTKIKRLF